MSAYSNTSLDESKVRMFLTQFKGTNDGSRVVTEDD